MKVTIARGSIGGLCAGIALRGIGADVQIFERESGPMDIRGAGIVVQPHLTSLLREHHAPELPVTSCQIRRYLDPVGGEGQTQLAPQDFTSWEAIYLTLRATFPEDRYHMGAEITDIAPEAARVIAAVEGREPVESDILIAADGANSPLRRRFLPHVAPRYAGYVAWRGTLDEADAPPRLVSFLDDAFTFCEARSGGHMLVYFIPGDGADVRPGRRRLNWVWYVGRGRAGARPIPDGQGWPPTSRLVAAGHGIVSADRRNMQACPARGPFDVRGVGRSDSRCLCANNRRCRGAPDCVRTGDTARRCCLCRSTAYGRGDREGSA